MTPFYKFMLEENRVFDPIPDDTTSSVPGVVLHGIGGDCSPGLQVFACFYARHKEHYWLITETTCLPRHVGTWLSFQGATILTDDGECQMFAAVRSILPMPSSGFFLPPPDSGRRLTVAAWVVPFGDSLTEHPPVKIVEVGIGQTIIVDFPEHKVTISRISRS